VPWFHVKHSSTGTLPSPHSIQFSLPPSSAFSGRPPSVAEQKSQGAASKPPIAVPRPRGRATLRAPREAPSAVDSPEPCGWPLGPGSTWMSCESPLHRARHETAECRPPLVFHAEKGPSKASGEAHGGLGLGCSQPVYRARCRPGCLRAGVLEQVRKNSPRDTRNDPDLNFGPRRSPLPRPPLPVSNRRTSGIERESKRRSELPRRARVLLSQPPLSPSRLGLLWSQRHVPGWSPVSPFSSQSLLQSVPSPVSPFSSQSLLQSVPSPARLDRFT
jgi:hypothetical protein